MITLSFYPAKPKTRSQRRASTPDASVGGGLVQLGAQRSLVAAVMRAQVMMDVTDVMVLRTCLPHYRKT